MGDCVAHHLGEAIVADTWQVRVLQLLQGLESRVVTETVMCVGGSWYLVSKYNKFNNNNKFTFIYDHSHEVEYYM